MVVEALGKLSWRPASPQDRARLAAARGDWTAAKAIGKAAVEPLLEYLVHDENGEHKFREKVLSALCEIGDPVGMVKALNALRVIWDADFNRCRFLSLEEKIVGAGGAAVEPLLEMLGDENRPGSDLVAIELLRRIGDPRAAKQLVGALGDTWAKQAITEALCALGGEAVVDALEEALSANRINIYICESAAWVLGTIGGARAVGVLLKSLQHPHPDVRAAVMDALGRLGDRSAVPAFIRSLGDAVQRVQDAAAYALLQFQDPESLAIMRVQGSKPETRDRIFANIREHVWRVAEPLARIGQWQVMEPLVHFIADSDCDAAVSQAIEGVTGLLAQLGQEVSAEALLAVAALPDSRTFEWEESYMTTIGSGGTDTMASYHQSATVDFRQTKTLARQELARRNV